MSNPDSFIEEVTEEVRRDRLFRLMRRYGWIAVALVLLLVAGAGYNEWRKAREQAAAQAFGDAILAALEEDSPDARRAALGEIEAEGAAEAVTTLLMAGDAGDAAPELAGDLRSLIADDTLPQAYRDLAAMKLALMDGTDIGPDERIELLEPLAAAGRPFRLLAQEQIALAHVERGDSEAAIDMAGDIIEDSDVTEDLRRRLSQLIVALGGSPEQG